MKRGKAKTIWDRAVTASKVAFLVQGMTLPHAYQYGFQDGWKAARRQAKKRKEGSP